MSFSAIFAMAVALAMDALAVSLTEGMRLGRVSLGHTLRMAGTFGLFQFAMPLAGWLLGAGAQIHIAPYAPWVAALLLFFVGGRMLVQAWKKVEEVSHDGGGAPTRGGALWLLGLATSLDALAAGVSLALLGGGIWRPALIIGAVCFCLSAGGLHLGGIIRRLPLPGALAHKADVLGGLALVGIGLNILWEHAGS